MSTALANHSTPSIATGVSATLPTSTLSAVSAAAFAMSKALR